VLFADLVGFTPFAEERDAEAVRDALSRYFEIASDVVTRYGGVVEKFIGDAVMAVWGAPTAQEDDAERAVRAALELVDSVHHLGPGIDARAGVLTGEAAVTIGAVNQGLVAGDLVNTASRLQSVAPPGAVLVGESTHRAASGAIAFEEAGPQTLKGKTAPIPAWRALRVIAQRGGHGRSDLPEPPFVGRTDELRALREAVTATGRDRRPRLVSITGPGGIGKSRLAWELEKYIDGVAEDIYWHRGRSPAYGEGITFWALGEMVRRRAGLAEGDDQATTRQRIEAIVTDYVPDEVDRRWVEPALLTLLGLEPAPAGGREMLFAAWRIFFERIAARGTTILLFEDLQWADLGLMDFIDHLLEWSKGVPILIVTLARPELFDRRPDWGAARRAYTAMSLEPLSEGSMRELLAGFVPGLPEPAVVAILRRADGIPLYAVETVRALVAEGKLGLADGVYRPLGELGDLAVPDSLRSLIASRLDALDPVDRSLVQDASVLGQAFTGLGLSALSGRLEAELEGHLRGLTRRQILELEADPRSPERGQYRFVQSLIREVAYSTLGRRDRRNRHLAAARYLESLGDDELAGVLAAHYLAAHEASEPGAEADALAGQARIALRGAAERAAALGGHQQAVAHAEAALRVAVTPGDRGDLLELAATSADAMSDYAAAEGYARGAMVEFQAADRHLDAARATALLSWTIINSGRPQDASAVLASAIADLPEPDRASDIAAVLLTHLSRAAFRSGAQVEAIAAGDRALAIAERMNLKLLIAEAFTNKAAALGFLGRRLESRALHEAALRLARTHGFVTTQLRATNNYSGGIFGDDPAAALEALDDGVQLARRVGNRGIGVWLAGTYAIFAFFAGRNPADSVAILEEELTQTSAVGDRLRTLTFLATIQAARGVSIDGILAEMDLLATQLSDPQLVSGLHLARGDAALARGDAATAAEHAELAIEALPEYAESALPIALRAAAWARDAAAARRAADKLATVIAGDRASVASLDVAGGILKGLAGDRDAAAIDFARARRALRELGMEVDLGRVGLDMVHVLGADDPDARAAIEESRAIFARLGTRAYLELVDGAIALRSGGVGSRGVAAARPAGTTVDAIS
jgi:class 3 adenylate cyclase/predicted ATPase